MRTQPGDPVGVDQVGLALHLELAEVVQLERRAGEVLGRPRDEDVTGLRRGLQAGSDVDRVTQGRVLVAQVAPDVPDDDRPGVDAGADREVDAALRLQLACELLGRGDHVEASADRALGVVLVGHRGTEEREHRVALELRDRALVAEDGRAHELEGLVDDRGPILGVHALEDRRRADDIGEQRGHGLALAGELRLAHLLDERRRGGRREAAPQLGLGRVRRRHRVAAVRAEARIRRDRRIAVRAEDHDGARGHRRHRTPPRPNHR